MAPSDIPSESGALQGRVVAVTGASSGIGEATALACARAGAAVALGARRGERVSEIAAAIDAEGGRAIAVPTDVTQEGEARAFIEAATEQLGEVDALVNNAGVMYVGPVLDAPTEEWRQMVDVNLMGLLYCTKAALAGMVKRGAGDVVNVGSVAGRHARAGWSVYNLTKFGVAAFSEALRQEVTGQGVRVTVIEPGVVATELQGHSRDGIREELLAGLGGMRPLAPDDVAEAIVYALSRPSHVSVNALMLRPTDQIVAS
jgi:NADP-dependent 3-hydroxy acid dehydrogenase YdfG